MTKLESLKLDLSTMSNMLDKLISSITSPARPANQDIYLSGILFIIQHNILFASGFIDSQLAKQKPASVECLAKEIEQV